MVKKLIGSVGLAPGTDTGFDLDTKGQLHSYTSTQYALDVGTNNFVVYADSTTSSGLAYGASAKSVLSGTGDLLYSSGANTLARLAVGTQYFNLQMGASLPAWSASSTSVLSASGDLLYSSGANTLAKLAKASDGDTLQLASGVPAWVTVSPGGGETFARKVKTADQETDGDSFIDDDELFVALTANKDYGFLLYSFWDPGNTDGSKQTFTLPSEAEGQWASGDWASSTQNNLTGLTSTVSQPALVGGDTFLPLAGYVKMGANAGNMQFQIAKTADASPFEITIKRGSFLVVWEEA